MKYLNQQGDTIVEVLIAIAIISSVLVAAYQTTRYNTQTTQTTQEHSQALKVAETQVESLRANGGLKIDQYSCFVAGSEAGPPAGPATDCVTEPNGSGTDPSYKTTITKDASGAFQVMVVWDTLSGTTDNVSLLYRPQVAAP